MKKILFCMFALLVLNICTEVYAAPVARVTAFPGGDGLEDFLINEGGRAHGPEDMDGPDVIVIKPLLSHSTVSLYNTEMNDEFKLVHKGEPFAVAELTEGEKYVFRTTVPEGMPNLMVCVTGEQGRDYFWTPAFSGEDGSLITNEEFIPWEGSAPNAEQLFMKLDLMPITISGENVNLRMKANTDGKPLRTASAPEEFIAEGQRIRDAAGNEWYKLCFTMQLLDDNLYEIHEIELYVSAKFAKRIPVTLGMEPAVATYMEGKKQITDSPVEWLTQKISHSSIAMRDTFVFEDSDPNSKVIGMLGRRPLNSDAPDDILITGVRMPEKGHEAPKDFSVWWRIEKPFSGWVPANTLGLFYSGFLSGM